MTRLSQQGRAILIALFLAFLLTFVVSFWVLLPPRLHDNSMWLFFAASVFIAALLAIDVRSRIVRRRQREGKTDDDRPTDGA